MGKELEYKLYVSDEQRLREILADAEMAALTEGEWQETPMKTTYFDTADRRFAARNWTFRHRMEGAESVVTVKTPHKDAHTRGEWQVSAPTVNDAAVEALLLAGAPKELLLLYGIGDVAPICGAEFLRRSVMLRFSDGSRAELAGDHGILHGTSEKITFTELELELCEGAPTEMLRLVQNLCERYGLHELMLSKFARAKALK